MAQRVCIKSGTWDRVKSEIVSDSAQRRDFNVKFKDLMVAPEFVGATDLDGNAIQATAKFIGDGKFRTMNLRDRAFGQYLSKLGIPFAFATTFSPDLQDLMIQERLRGEKAPDPDSDVFVRTRPGLVRAFLSGRYGDMQDLAVAEIIDRHLPSLEGFTVHRGVVSEDLFSVTLIGVEPIHRNGDSYYPIHRIHNSETGAKSFEVSSGICKGACSNGMIFAFQRDMRYRIRHLGSKMAESVEVALTSALTGQRRWAETIAPAIERAHETLIDLGDQRQLEKVIKELRDRGMTKRFATETLALAQDMPQDVYGDEFRQGAQITRWHVVNAMTHLAQDMSELDRYATETAAGALLLARAA